MTKRYEGGGWCEHKILQSFVKEGSFGLWRESDRYVEGQDGIWT